MMHNDDNVETLLRKAGKRSAPDVDLTEEIKSATRKAWQETVEKRRKLRVRRLGIASGIAASLLFGVIFSFQNWVQQPGYEYIAQFTNVSGDIRINGETSSALNISPGDTLTAGKNALMSVVMNNGITLLANENTELEMLSEERIFLVKGRIYFDSADSASSLVIDTRLGQVKDIGTQYELLSDGTDLKVSMREGETSLSLPDGKSIRATSKGGSGDVVEVSSNGSVERSTIGINDTYWDWISDSHDDINLEGKSLYEVISLASRITGKKAVYITQNAKQVAKLTTMSGGTLNPDHIETALPLLMETTTLSIVLKSDTIEIASPSKTQSM